MSLNRNLFRPQAFERPQGLSWDAPADALRRWAAHPVAAVADGGATITIFEMIGEDRFTGGGVTAKRISAALRAIGGQPVTVQINSPGGDVFEGLAIYNLLADHPQKVTVEVVGIAASAASIIAMAGDEVRMLLGTFLMVHNAWGGAIGNRHDMAHVAEILGQIDMAMAEIYAARSGLDIKALGKLMDAETYLSAQAAVDKKLADQAVSAQAEPAQHAAMRTDIAAKRQLDAILAEAGLPRSERRRLFKEISGTPSAADNATHDAGAIAAAQRLLETILS